METTVAPSRLFCHRELRADNEEQAILKTTLLWTGLFWKLVIKEQRHYQAKYEVHPQEP